MTYLLQKAPWPEDLEDLVKKCVYRPGWEISLDHNAERDTVDGKVVGQGATLVVRTRGYDSYHPERGETYGVFHYFIVPAATYNRQSWQRWLLDQLLKVEQHECCEFFQIDGERPFAPRHGPGCDPYTIVEYAPEVDRRTRFTGEVLDERRS